jgi:hypothetical protein
MNTCCICFDDFERTFVTKCACTEIQPTCFPCYAMHLFATDNVEQLLMPMQCMFCRQPNLGQDETDIARLHIAATMSGNAEDTALCHSFGVTMFTNAKEAYFSCACGQDKSTPPPLCKKCQNRCCYAAVAVETTPEQVAFIQARCRVTGIPECQTYAESRVDFEALFEARRRSRRIAFAEAARVKNEEAEAEAEEETEKETPAAKRARTF